MLYGLVEITWFDITTVGFTFVTVLLVKIINGFWSTTLDDDDTAAPTSDNISGVTKSLKINELKSLISSDSTTNDLSTSAAITTTATNGKLQKQQSEQTETGSLPSTSSSSLSTTPSSPPPPPPPPPPPTQPILSSFQLSSVSPTACLYPLHVRNSVSYLFNGNGATIPPATHHPLSLPDNLSDEYHEDEDTLSLENLFPCDQSEIKASKQISFIIDEFLQTEENYVNYLRKGLQNYGCLQNYDPLPETLKGEDKQLQLLGNIAEILALHEKEILPLMLRNQNDLKCLFDEMAQYIDRNQFYCYVNFTMHKKTSLVLRKENREFFQNYQNAINDRLGIDSFLVQPIQRLTRYPLLLQQLIAEFYKSGINCKPVLASLCKLETRMRRLLEVVNQAEEIYTIEELPPELNIELFGCFRRSTEFDAYNHKSRKKYRCKVFLFEQCLLCTEVRKRSLAFKHHYAWYRIELKLNSSKSITLLSKRSLSLGSSNGHSSVKEEYEFSSAEAILLSQWLRCARRIIEQSRREESQRGRFVLPMDLILGVVFAIWFIWHYL